MKTFKNVLEWFLLIAAVILLLAALITDNRALTAVGLACYVSSEILKRTRNRKKSENA